MKKFKFISGCTVSNISVNNEDFSDMEVSDKIETIKLLIEYVLAQNYDDNRNDILEDCMKLLIPCIATDVKEFSYNEDNERDTITVYTYKDNKDKVIVVDCGWSEHVIINNESYFGFNITQEIKNVFKKVIEKSGTNCYLNNIFMDILKTYGKMKFLYHCDQCGDNVYEYCLKIK